MTQERHFYEFGPFRLDITERQLQCNGKVVALTPKAFEVLTVLAANPGRLLTKEELLRLGRGPWFRCPYINDQRRAHHSNQHT